MSEPLIQQIKQHLQRKQQVLLFLNRRGYAPTLLCHDCGFIAVCRRCDRHLTLHQSANQLRCHHCQHCEPTPKQCPTCASDNLLAIGKGTQRLESALTHIFPDTNIARIDRDSTRKKEDFHEALAKIESGEHQLLIGTQMLAKGHHFPKVSLVALVDVDSGLFSSDFRATEKLGQLIVQVAGRAGRAETPGEVILQTHHPEHPLLNCLINHAYNTFLETLLTEREAAQLPPYAHLAILKAQANTLEKTLAFLQDAKRCIGDTLQTFGPTPSAMPKKAGLYRAELILQSQHRNPLHNTLQHLQKTLPTLNTSKSVRWLLDIDPTES